ncbi:PRA1 family protein B6-like [Pyrus ussuriensis x Pyrus communis]|uniref:PRA1 family protein n=1 Tax=Pyrus ussuriensis x Pyrus communis TaxID=2448454 RepID=A0A5N5HKX9_9ROSA|nr:PRA1 family protein B6-like [Pyrus ussuriensis x Pyrus communis]
MASYGTVQRPSTTSTPPPPPTATDDLNQRKDSTGKKRNDSKLFCLFNIPATPEATAVRIVRNFSYFGLYYTLFIFTILSITLVPQRKDSLIFLTVMTVVGCLYLVLLRVVPESLLLHKTVERLVVLVLLAIGTMIELILTDAAVHLFVTLASVIPILLVHAVFRVRDDVFVEEAGGFGEFVPLTTTDESKLSESV